MQVKPTQTEIRERLARSHDNEFAAHIFLDSTPLPAPTLVGRPDAVFVMVADVDDLGAWLEARGGTIRVGAAEDGVRVWSLYTSLPPRGDGSRVRVRVSVAVVADEQVMDFVRAAVLNPGALGGAA